MRGASGLGGKSELLVSYGLHYDSSAKRARLENFFLRAQESMDVDGANQEADPSAATAGGTVPPAPAAPIPTPQQAAAPPSPAPAAARVPTPQSPQQQAPVPTPAPSTAPTGAPKAAEAKADGQGNRTSIGQGHDSDWLLDVTGSVPQIKVVNTATGNKRIPKKSLVRFEAVGPFGHSATRFYSSRFASTVVDVAKCLCSTACRRQSDAAVTCSCCRHIMTSYV